MTVPEKLLREAEKLNTWFDEATKQVNATYATWQEAGKVGATSVIDERNPHPEENQTSTLDVETENLVKMMQTLMQTTKETSLTTADSAAKVKDVALIIKELKDSTTKVQDHAQNILANLNDSIDESKKTTKENEEYAKTFEKYWLIQETAVLIIHGYLVSLRAQFKEKGSLAKHDKSL